MPQVVVIGAGVGGLTTAAALAHAGVEVTVLEAQVYPGGCAGTFFHQGYRFDAGATLAGGFYPGGPMDLVAQAVGIPGWESHPAEVAMLVHLPGGQQVTRLAHNNDGAEYQAAFGRPAFEFFRWQQTTADALWDLALRLPPWPPQSPADLARTAAVGLPWLGAHLGRFSSLAADALHPLAVHLKDAPESLRLFVDGQLLISAQATSERANALYGAAALDLPRRGVAHLPGGMGSIAEKLAEAVRGSGGKVLYRQPAARIRLEKGRPVAVETQRGEWFPADSVVANLTPWDAVELFEGHLPYPLRRLPPLPADAWGAFVVYVGLDGSALPADLPLHHQVILQRPLGEGNSVFASLSPEWDGQRAAAGGRALTLSTHTALDGWWQLYAHDRPAYQARKAALAEKMLLAAELALPGLRAATRLVLPGTPVTFQRFTHRRRGWVGGFPQTGLHRNFGPRLGPYLWLVGDSIFPGQSTAAVALGGLRVAHLLLRDLGIRDIISASPEENRAQP